MFGIFLLTIIGLMVGWLYSSFTNGGRLGQTANLVIAIVGSFLGGLLFQQFGGRLVGETEAVLLSFAVALVTSIVVLIVANLLKR